MEHIFSCRFWETGPFLGIASGSAKCSRVSPAIATFGVKYWTPLLIYLTSPLDLHSLNSQLWLWISFVSMTAFRFWRLPSNLAYNVLCNANRDSSLLFFLCLYDRPSCTAIFCMFRQKLQVGEINTGHRRQFLTYSLSNTTASINLASRANISRIEKF